MATIIAGRRRKISLAVDGFDRLLASAALVLLAAVVIAIARGWSEWEEVAPVIWGHIATIVIALVLTPVMLLRRRRGDRLHRRLGWVWAGAMFLTALMSFWIRHMNDGRLSWIHILSAWTIVQVPLIVISARRHDHATHRMAVRGMVTGALLIAGFFTFPFDRLMGRWLFG